MVIFDLINTISGSILFDKEKEKNVLNENNHNILSKPPPNKRVRSEFKSK